MNADVIIPTYKPDIKFFTLIARLLRQTVRPHRIIIMNTDEEKWDLSGAEDKLIESGASSLCEVHHIAKKDFDHGHTRNTGVSYSDAPFFVMMTQDAIPQNDTMIEALLSPMNDEIKMTYARQIPDRGANAIERFSRYFNYPEESRTKTEADAISLGIKTYFASNVCAAYDRAAFDSLGGFPDRAIFNEDMVYAGKLLKSGKALRYCASAVVYHSHSYTASQQIRRNFDLAVSQKDNPEIFAGIKSEKEGKKLVQTTAEWLKKQGEGREIPKLYWISGCKYLGYCLGRNYRKLPGWLVKKLSMNKTYWEKRK